MSDFVALAHQLRGVARDLAHLHDAHAVGKRGSEVRLLVDLASERRGELLAGLGVQARRAHPGHRHRRALVFGQRVHHLGHRPGRYVLAVDGGEEVALLHAFGLGLGALEDIRHVGAPVVVGEHHPDAGVAALGGLLDVGVVQIGVVVGGIGVACGLHQVVEHGIGGRCKVDLVHGVRGEDVLHIAHPGRDGLEGVAGRRGRKRLPLAIGNRDAPARHQFGLAAQGETPDEGDGDEDDREEHAEQPVARRLINPPLAAGPGVGGEMPPVAFFGHGRSLHVTPSI